MKRFFYLILSIIVALLFWLADSAVHHYIYGEQGLELWPSDGNELMMRLIVVMLMCCFGSFADYHVKKLMERERLLRADIYGSTLSASHHILNNLLNQMQLFQMEAESCNDFDAEILREFERVSGEAQRLITQLSEIQEVSPQQIRESVHMRPSRV